jgi:hypothetical protein
MDKIKPCECCGKIIEDLGNNKYCSSCSFTIRKLETQIHYYKNIIKKYRDKQNKYKLLEDIEKVKNGNK